MSQPDEDRFNEAPDPEPDLLVLAPLTRAALLRAERSLPPAARPTTPAGGSASITTETPGPAIDMFGRLAR